jgi:hypothetical protein
MANKPTISARVHVSLENIENVLYSAARGISYWAVSDGLIYVTTVQAMLRAGASMQIWDKDSGESYLLNIHSIKRGLTKMANVSPHAFADILTEDADMDTGDIFVQFCLFGEVKYG